MHFYAPIGQHIAHVEKIEAHFDKDMGMRIIGATEVSQQVVQSLASSVATPAEELFHFIHPEVDDSEEMHIHKSVKKLVSRFCIKEICEYLTQLAKQHKILLPQKPGVVYDELVRLGMPNDEGFAFKTFEKHYQR